MLRTMSASDHREAKIGHDGHIYTTEIGQYPKSEFLPTMAIVKHLPVTIIIVIFFKIKKC